MQVQAAKEICQTQLSNRTLGHIDKVQAAHVIKPINLASHLQEEIN